MKILHLPVFLLIMLFLTACANSSTPDPGAPMEETTNPSTGSSPVAPAGTVDLSKLTPSASTTEDPQEMPRPGIPDPSRYLVSQASQDLAERLGIDVGEIEVLELEEVDWPDASLGCPQEGLAYQTVVTPGYRILLAAGGNQYSYHTDRDKRFVYCLDGRPVP